MGVCCNQKGNNQIAITRYAQSKHPDDTITFVSRSKYSNYMNGIPVKTDTTYAYKLHSQAYDEDFYCYYINSKEDGKLFADAYSNLTHYKGLKAELETILDEFGPCEFYFTPACIGEYKYADYSDDWYDTARVSIAVLMEEKPKDVGFFEEKVRQAFDNSTFHQIDYFDVAFFFGSCSGEFTDIFNDNAQKQTPLYNSDWEFSTVSPYYLNFNLIEPYTVQYMKMDRDEAEVVGIHFVEETDENAEDAFVIDTGYALLEWK